MKTRRLRILSSAACTPNKTGRAFARPDCTLAEEVGFEPTEPCGSTVFKTAALNHSAIPPFVQPIVYHRKPSAVENRGQPRTTEADRPRTCSARNPCSAPGKASPGKQPACAPTGNGPRVRAVSGWRQATCGLPAQGEGSEIPARRQRLPEGRPTWCRLPRRWRWRRLRASWWRRRSPP